LFISRDQMRVPEPRRKGGGFMRAVLWLCLLLLLAAGGAFFGKAQYEAEGPLDADQAFTIERGMNARAVAKELEGLGIIRSADIFTVAAYITRDFRRIKAGEYLAPAGASMATLMDIIVQGKEYTFRLTIPEGWTSQMAIERINAASALGGNPVEVPAEGTLLPDTYTFRRGFDRQELIDKMAKAQSDLIAELWPKRAADLPIQTPEEAIILASIVEKETSVPAERPQVAAVFINRLRLGMRLQSDPTVIYGIVGGKGKLDRPISKADLRQETPYNTYRIKALPPGPIANPGPDSIAAVLNPAVTEDLYFVADGSGGHAFSKTLDDHNANVKEWRELQKRLAEENELEAADEAVAPITVPEPENEAAKPAIRLPVPRPATL
jgi:UPF0755 protein